MSRLTCLHTICMVSTNISGLEWITRPVISRDITMNTRTWWFEWRDIALCSHPLFHRRRTRSSHVLNNPVFKDRKPFVINRLKISHSLSPRPLRLHITQKQSMTSIISIVFIRVAPRLYQKTWRKGNWFISNSQIERIYSWLQGLGSKLLRTRL